MEKGGNDCRHRKPPRRRRHLVTNNFLATLDPRNREIVVLLASGKSRTEVAEQLGYANHSAISKRLARIGKAAASYLDGS